MSKRSTTVAKQDSIDRFLEAVLPRFPYLDPSTEAAVDRMTRIVKYLDRVSGKISSRFGLNAGEFKVLLKLDRHGAMAAGELAEVLNLSTGAKTNRIDGLEEAGFVTRTRDLEDRRSVVVEVTASGREVLDRIVAAQGGEERDLLAVLSPTQRDRLNDLLRELVLSIEGPDAADPHVPGRNERAEGVVRS
jgi:DNA-binding MarR family transcriptional regulator